jgi:hypothetical protein
MNLVTVDSTRKFPTDPEKVVRWAISRLMPRTSTLFIEVESYPMELDEYGYCERLGPRHFVITLNSKMTDKEMVGTVLHEMVHVRQYVRGHLKDVLTKRGSWQMLWKGRISKHKYEKQPWEIEAYGLEESLYKEFRNDS